MKTNIFGTEYEIDENAEQSDENDHSVHHRDKSDAQSLHCHALFYKVISVIGWGMNCQCTDHIFTLRTYR